MTLVSPQQSNPGDTIEASDINNPVNQISAVLNGNVDDTNVSGISGTKITDATITAAKMATAANPETRMSETLFDFVASGCVITGTGYGTTLGWSMTSGVVYIGGKRLTVSSATGTVTASKDTYFDLLSSGSTATLVNTGGNIVANNAASPALAANSIRIGIVVSGATIANAGSINQGQETAVLPIASSIPYTVTDSLGNLINPRDPNRRTIGYRQITSNFATSAGADVTGLSTTVNVPSGRKILVSLYVSQVLNASNNAMNLNIAESATVLNNVRLNMPSNLAYGVPMPIAFVTPSAGVHTYRGTVSLDLAATITIIAASTNPAFIRVELV